ncbi:carboxypeptidase B-like [Ostrinia furnacalis]|uniref:carboxypeptidase B-like n=1 Tax=Ostrinia furnacalis TaxID=93504 RepID=UPI00103D9583|nr:carboxypeptidase B-like [Ostrinia furnacalis]
MDWNRYHKYEDIIAFLNYLSISYPNITEVKVLGKSHEEREIRLFRLSNGNSSNKAVFIESGIHAREWISVATVTYIINELTTHFDDESDDIRNIDWYFVPIINPDGYYHTHKSTGGDRLWRKNRRHTTGSCFGVDLNRNFGYGWITKKNHGIDNCKEDYAGPHAFSEAETIAIHDFILNSAINFTAYLSYHSYGQFILYPYGYNQTNIDNYKELHDIAEGMAKAVGYRYHVGNSAKMLYPASGLSNDWAASIE